MRSSYDYGVTRTLAQEIRNRIPKTKIESLTDLIFGLALSIGAVSLLSKPPLSPADVMTDLVGFGFSFLILISIWFRYTNIMSVLPVETSGMMFLNVVMLFLVSVEPYLLSLLTFGSVEASRVAIVNFASEAYALDMAGLNLILGVFAHQLTIEERKLVNPELAGRYRRNRNVSYFVAVLFAVSTLPFFWSWEIMGTPVRFYLWYTILTIAWISRLSGRFKKKSGFLATHSVMCARSFQAAATLLSQSEIVNHNQISRLKKHEDVGGSVHPTTSSVCTPALA